MDFWKVEIHPNSEAQEASANRVLGTRRVSAPFPRLPKAVLPISTCQIALPCPKSLLCTATLLQLTTVLVLQLIDILPLAFAFSLFCLASMAHQVHHACQNPFDSFVLPTASWQNPSPRWMEPSACFVCACARTVERPELNYTSPWSTNSRSSTSSGPEDCLAPFLYCCHRSKKTS